MVRGYLHWWMAPTPSFYSIALYGNTNKLRLPLSSVREKVGLGESGGQGRQCNRQQLVCNTRPSLEAWQGAELGLGTCSHPKSSRGRCIVSYSCIILWGRFLCRWSWWHKVGGIIGSHGEFFSITMNHRLESSKLHTIWCRSRSRARETNQCTWDWGKQE